VEPDLFGGYDPNRKEYLHEVAIEEDLPEFDSTLATAEAFKLRHGDKVTIRRAGNPDEYKVQIKRGAHILVPKTLPFDGVVAGQIPTGWNPVKYGIPEDLIAQVDPVTLYALCCAAEALYSAGIVDSLEIFKHIHVSELGNFIGPSAGGATKTRSMYKDRYLDKQVQGDVIQETYINTPAAWINMLLLGSAGPIKTPVGACATGVESLDSGCESILSGKTKMCFIGGTDDFQEDESYAFATMKVTVNTNEEFSKGRLPHEMSRPTAETLSGFVESQGCGVQLICSAELALEMGLPIYGVIASSTMAADKISRSLPAPGQGVLSFARETPEAAFSPLLSMDYRREQMKSSISGIQQWYSRSLQKLQGEGTLTPSSMDSDEMLKPSGPSSANLLSTLESAANAHIKTAKKLWGNDFRRQNPDISPLRAALAVYGLTVDDIEIASLHATSTKANDKNEPEVINKEMLHLGRTPGRPIMAICQKSLTGHPKAPAAAFMLNGALQALNSGIVPGNRTADNVDEVLRKFEHLVFPTVSINTGRELKAFLLNSFGFGQKGGQVVGIAPRYFFATLKKTEYEAYTSKVTARKRIANRAYIRAMLANSIFKAKAAPAYHAHDETTLLIDPLARISENADTKELRFDGANLHPVLPAPDLLAHDMLTPTTDIFSDTP
jgi:fatty acid synthase subunit alpha, fungi type